MNLIVESSSDALAHAAAAELAGFGTVTIRTGSPTAVELLHRPGIDLDALQVVLQPLQPTIRAVADLDADAVLLLGDAQPLSAWGVRIECDSDAFANRVRSSCDAVGFGRLGESFTMPEDDVLTHSGASSFARRVLLWQLARLGVTAREHKQPGKASVICLSLRDPAGAGVSLAQRFPVRVRSDDPRQVESFRLWLQQAGFRPEVGEPLTEAEALAAAFTLAPGPFGANRAPAQVRQLTDLLRDLIDDTHIDTGRYPLRVLPDSEGPFAEIILPIKACRSGRKPPYSGAFPERFAVRIRSDDIDRAEALRARLTEAGFARIGIEEVPSAQLEQGFAIRWGSAGREPGIAAMLRTNVGTVMAEQGAGPPFELVAVDHSDPDSTEVLIDFPMVGLDDGSLLVRLSNPAPYAIVLRAPDPNEWDDVLAVWRSWGFRECTADKAEVPAPRLEFDGVPAVLAERVRTLLADCSGLSVTPARRPTDGEPAIWVYLPRRPAGTRRATMTPATSGGFDLGTWFVTGLGPPRDRFGSFVEVTADRVRIANVWLPRRAESDEPFVPDPAGFAHFCLDGRTAETLAHLAAAVALREPCLMEGETSTSKTSTVLYLAALLRQPVVRINLNGQTDTGELVGRYVPYAHQEHDHDPSPQPPPIVGRIANPSHSGEWLGRGRETGPQSTSQWRWQDGPVVLALKRGWWVLLDEVNLAEPQVLERLNSVLERDPMLVLTEHDHSAFGPGGRPIHADFRVFATMNPAEYSGRSILSPAYRDRWRAHRFIPRPSEGEYRAMLEFLVFGRQPEVTVLGRTYPSSQHPAPLAALASWPEVRTLLPALASFHTALENASGHGEDTARLGARRKERYIFTRRGLLSFVEYLASPFGLGDGAPSRRAVREALLRYYLGRVSSPTDQRTIVQLVEAAGLGT
jgi:MoxR-like ATPase